MFFDYNNAHRTWKAKWIWESEQTANSWVVFRKKLHFDAKPTKFTANISVESRYWLYVNGKNVVFEGSLKRGINIHDSFYDEIDLAPYLTAGDNVIAVLCWYWGVKGFSYSCNFAGKAGFIFEAETDAESVISDSSWKVHRETSYLKDDGSVEGVKEPQPNYRLSEYNVYYDARLSIGDWKAVDYDDSSWANATELGVVPDKPWCNLHKRPIPFLKDFGLKDYNNSKDYEGYTTTKEEVLDLYLDYNAQLTPYIKLKTDTAGLKIDMRTDNYADPAGNGLTTKNAYVTVAGEQEFEGLSWFPGEHVYYTIPAGITILSLKYRESGYNSEFVGYFRCDDEFFNKLWTQSERTLYVTMRDNFMDCPDRERAQWWGDVTNEMLEFMYCLDDKAYMLYEKGLRTKMGYADTLNTTRLRTVCPSYNDNTELPMQELAGVCGMWEYYLYTGNTETLKVMYKYASKYVLYSWLWYMADNGFVNRYTGTWDWPDWGRFPDMVPLENAWYCRAIIALRKMAEILGEEKDIAEIDKRYESIKKNYRKFWTERGYKSAEQDDPDDRCNAIALLAGIVPEENIKTTLNVLNTTMNSSPYMEKYVLDALCEYSNMKDIQARIKMRYHDMTDSELAYSTLWEFWDKTKGTKNHAWSGGPLITMSKYMAGIRPLTHGYKTYLIEPRMGSLNRIEARVPAVIGNIMVSLEKDCEKFFRMDVTAPEGGKATLSIPCCKFADTADITINGIKVIENGVEVGKVDGIEFAGRDKSRYNFVTDGGNWQIVATKH